MHSIHAHEAHAYTRDVAATHRVLSRLIPIHVYMCTYKCVYAYMCTYICVHAYICKYTCACIHVHICMCMHSTYTCACIHMHIYMCMHTWVKRQDMRKEQDWHAGCVYMCMYVATLVCMYKCIHACITCIHACGCEAYQCSLLHVNWRACVHVYMCATLECIPCAMSILLYTQTYIYIHTHIHTYIHTYISYIHVYKYTFTHTYIPSIHK